LASASACSSSFLKLEPLLKAIPGIGEPWQDVLGMLRRNGLYSTTPDIRGADRRSRPALQLRSAIT